MRFTPIISVLVAVVLGVVIYFGANTNPPMPKSSGEKPAMGAGQMPAAMQSHFDIDSFIVASKKSLAQHALGELQGVEKKLMALSDSSQMPSLFTEYAKIWQEHKYPSIAAYYYSLSAKLENSEKKLTFAAQLFLDLARNEHSAELQNWEANSAKACFERCVQLNPQNDTIKIGLAECYFGTGEAMKGVVLLKELTTKDPENIAANLLLGQQGIISGQFDKAQQRFEAVLKKEPKNLDALLGLAEVYKELGEKEKAKALLENFKNLVNNPAVAKEVDNYIKTF